MDRQSRGDAFVKLKLPSQVRQITLATLGDLQQQDPEFAAYVVETFGDETKAWRWFVAKSRPLKATPRQLFSEGKRREVLQELGQIRDGGV